MSRPAASGGQHAVRWRSLHVHYYGEDVDSLILDAVRPLFTRVRAQVPAAYFVRHWRRGPHLRLNLRADPDVFASVVGPAATELVGGFLTARPSRAVPEPRRWLPVHRRLAELERERGLLLPWRPDNSLHVVPYDRRLHVLGSEAAADLLAEYLTDTTELVFQMTEHVRDGGQRLRLAFDLMIAVAHRLAAGGITAGFVSYRSHAEAFLTSWPEAKGQREAWERHYRSHKPDLVRRVRAVVATVDGTATTAPFTSAFVDALAPFQRRGHELIEAGELSMELPPPVSQEAAAALAQRSPFHQALLANDWFVRHVEPSVWFAAYRLVLNYTYLQLTRLGVRPVERFLLCHLAANAVEDCYGCSAYDLVRAPHQRPSQPSGQQP